MTHSAAQSILIEAQAPYSIYGTLYPQAPQNSATNTDTDTDADKKLIINVHGLTQSQWGYLQINCLTTFNEAGYDVFNFSFYDRLPKSRRMSKSTLSTHKDDLERVIAHFRDQYDAIYLTGHSLGGLVTLLLNPADIKAVSLWDPSFDVTHLWAITNCLTHLSDRNAYILDYGAEYVLNADMVEELKDYPNDACLKEAADFSSPTQMVIPELSIFLASPHTSPAQYDEVFTAPYERKTLTQTDHCFYGQGKDQELFAETLSWFNRF